jgi:hypothetical protein
MVLSILWYWSRFSRKAAAILVMRNFFDAQAEETGAPEGEQQARIELAGLDGVDRLPGYIPGVGQLGLRPVAPGAQHRDPVLIGSATCRTKKKK